LLPTWHTVTEFRFQFVWLVLLLLQACGSSQVRAPVGDHSDRPVLNPGYHQVRTGDTLYSIAWQYGYSVRELASWNRLGPPYTIYRGQKLRVKPVAVSRKSTVSRTAPVKSSKPKVAATRPAPRPSKKSPTPVIAKKPVSVAATPKQKSTATAAGSKTVQKIVWSWPARGSLVRRYSASSAGKKGVDIGGRAGDPVYAAADGKVVYAGSGLSGYGRLIIIKHNKDFLSAYAHNRKLLAKEGQWIGRGEEIASMGDSGTNRVQLHFEIRKGGRPVDPLIYLPGR
jgi:lipoprotein NlpD